MLDWKRLGGVSAPSALLACLLACALLGCALLAAPAHAQASPPDSLTHPDMAPPPAPRSPTKSAAEAEKTAPPDAALHVVNVKFNAYVAFMNRTLRAVDSLNRYQSWVNMKTGPTGRERLIYGLYDVYDTRSERKDATAMLTQEPLIPDLDAAMHDYIAANDTLGPILTEANAYYDRADYKVDKMAGGKALHARIVAAAGPFLAARARLETVFEAEKAKVDALELAAIERREGRGANWHVANTMLRAKQIINLLPTGRRPVVDLAAFDGALTTFGAAVKDMDTYGAAHPGSFFVYEGEPRSLLSGLRGARDLLARAKGDGHRTGAFSMIIDQYNLMVTTSRDATQFAK